MNEKIKDSLRRIESASGNVARARVVILAMAQAEGNFPNLSPAEVWDAFRLIGDALLKAFEEIDEAREDIEDELKTGSTRADEA